MATAKLMLGASLLTPPEAKLMLGAGLLTPPETRPKVSCVILSVGQPDNALDTRVQFFVPNRAGYPMWVGGRFSSSANRSQMEGSEMCGRTDDDFTCSAAAIEPKTAASRRVPPWHKE